MSSNAVEYAPVQMLSLDDPVRDLAFKGVSPLPSEQAWLSLLAALRSDSALRLLYSLVVKSCLDVCMSLVLLVVLSPILLVVAIAIRIESSGPIIFRQSRIGKNGRPFTMYKFRTMCPDRRQQKRPFDGSERRLTHKRSDDPRITRVGRFLRSTSIDELPQLINILRRDMSFVGPRPELPMIVAKYAPWQHTRHLVLPGLTGWWQVQGRSDLPMHAHTELDIFYVINQSWWLDLKIVVQTFRVVLLRSGAY